MDLEQIKAKAAQLSPWAHLATVGTDGKPDVSPVHPAWEGDTVWFMVGADSIKARNVAANPNVALHWQVTEAGDGLEVWGTGSFHDDADDQAPAVDRGVRLRPNLFSPGGPDDSPARGSWRRAQPRRVAQALRHRRHRALERLTVRLTASRP